MNTKETDYIKSQFIPLGRQEKINLLSNSSLNDVEILLLTKRFIQGVSLKECSDIFGIEINSVSKKQQKAVRKFYTYLINNQSTFSPF